MTWEPERFRASWDALAIRDLEIIPECRGQGVGTWAIEQAKQLAADRG